MKEGDKEVKKNEHTAGSSELHAMQYLERETLLPCFIQDSASCMVTYLSGQFAFEALLAACIRGKTAFLLLDPEKSRQKTTFELTVSQKASLLHNSKVSIIL